MSAARALRFTNRGLPRDVLHLEDIPVPPLPPPASVRKEYKDKPWVLVRASYAALNPGGSYFIVILPTFSHAKTSIPEIEFCGQVLDTWTPGESTDSRLHVQKGDRVAGMIPTALSAAGIGALATHVAVPADLVVKLPENVSEMDAAGLILGGMTAIRMARDGEIKQGHRVLVNGASGGVGTMAVQVARNLVGEQGKVVAICSGQNGDLVKSLGADEVIDYLAYKFLPGELTRRYSEQKFDSVLDCVGIPGLYSRSAGFLQPGKSYVGTIVKPHAMTLPSFASAVAKLMCNTLWPTSRWLGGAGTRWKTVYMMDASREEREELVAMVADGRIRVVVDSAWSFEDVLKAYEVMLSGRARGKILIKLGEDES